MENNIPPQDMAQELFHRFNKEGLHQISSVINRHIRRELIKQCVLLSINLHLNELSKMQLIFSDRELHYKYWKEVESEVKKL